MSTPVKFYHSDYTTHHCISKIAYLFHILSHIQTSLVIADGFHIGLIFIEIEQCNPYNPE